MAKYRKHEAETTEFLTNLYGLETCGRIEVRAKSIDGPVVAREFCSTFDKVERFADKYGKKEDKLAVYYGVGKRNEGAKEGKKADVMSVPALWSDIDVGKHGWDYEKIARAFYDLPGCLQPSALMHSGGGLHAYWLLDEPFVFEKDNWEGDADHWRGEVIAFEEVNKKFAHHTGGDNVFDITRVLRLPGTFNARRNKACHVVYFHRWQRTSIDQLEQALDDFNLYLGPDGFVPLDQLPAMTAGSEDERSAYFQALDLGRRGFESKHESIWQRTRFGGGFPFYGIDEAQLLSTAYLWAFEKAPEGLQRKRDDIARRVLLKTKEVAARDVAVSGREWDWGAEEVKIREKLGRWEVKWNCIQEVKRQQDKAEKAAAKASKKFGAVDG